MCGIAGIFSYSNDAPPVDVYELRKIRDHMRNRGPDGKGEWLSSPPMVGLAHRRLSIIDVKERSAQPMICNNGRYVISFNGEIYNYRALRCELQKKGNQFRTTSDTEVILNLFAEKGVAMLSELRGMFAIALWDNKEKKILLARDPYGIKPLYYSDNGKTLRFASQVKALLAGSNIAPQQDPAGLVGFYLFGSVPEPFTMHKQIKAVPAGTYQWITNQGISEPVPHASIPEILITGEHSENIITKEEFQQKMRKHLLDSVKHHMVSDVPVGAFLSAGIDSGALVGLMSEISKGSGTPITTITLGFDEFKDSRDDEVPLAELISKKYGTQHVTRRVSEAEFQEDLPKILAAMDQPSIDGLNTWFVSKAAKEQGLKVAISGLGGDELFGGYPAFCDIPHWVKYFSILSKISGLGDLTTKIGNLLGSVNGRINPKAWGLIKYGGSYASAYLLKRGLFMPWELPALLDKDLLREGLQTLKPIAMIEKLLDPCPDGAFQRVATMESCVYMRNQLLRDSDWASMAHSLEIRVPLVDITLLKNLAPLIATENTDECKIIFGQTPTPPLPSEILARKKTGFRTPVENWMSNLENKLPQQHMTTPVCKKQPWARSWARKIIAAQ